MNLFMILSFLFSIGSFLGWILEAVYRRFISDSNPERKWINPGALIGPCLPLYGVSLILLYLLARLELYLPIGEPALCKAVLFIAMTICITVVEYITGLIFIVKFKMRLWDYSQNRLNIKGILDSKCITETGDNVTCFSGCKKFHRQLINMLKIPQQKWNVDFLGQIDHHPRTNKTDHSLHNRKDRKYNNHKEQRILEFIG